ncbi:MAG: hypothetical protein R2706_10590 [Acidimicrobiales bacterium]
MSRRRQPAIGRLLVGTLFLASGLAFFVAGSTTIDGGAAASLGLIVGGAVVLVALLVPGRIQQQLAGRSASESE